VRHGSFDQPVHPQGAKKGKSRLKASRSPVYFPTSRISQTEASLWLNPKNFKH
jgi:hypothetical protein